VAEEALLYTTEVFQPGGAITLAGGIEGQVEEDDLALLVAGLDGLFALGGGKSRGLGWCRCQFEVWQIEEGGVETAIPLSDIRRRWQDDPDPA